MVGVTLKNRFINHDCRNGRRQMRSRVYRGRPLSAGNCRKDSFTLMFLSYIARNELTQKYLICMIFKMPVNHFISCNPLIPLPLDSHKSF